MEKEYFGYVYKTTVPPTENHPYERFYIGQHSSPILDIHYFGSGRYIRDIIRKYGTKNFKIEVLAWADSFDELNKLEEEFIDKILKDPLYLNIMKGGHNNFYNVRKRKYKNKKKLLEDQKRIEDYRKKVEDNKRLKIIKEIINNVRKERKREEIENIIKLRNNRRIAKKLGMLKVSSK